MRIHLNLFVIGLLLCLLLAPLPLGAAQSGRPLRIMASERTTVAEAKEHFLNAILAALKKEGITPKDGTVIHLTQFASPMLLVPLVRDQHAADFLCLYYLPQRRQYFFLQVANNTNGRPEMRLWSKGDEELLVSEDAVGILPIRSANTFRLSNDNNSRESIGREELSWGDAFDCITKTLGITLDLTSLRNYFANFLCSSLKGFALVQTFGSCAGVLSLNPVSTYLCAVGIAKIVSCGYANCGANSSATIQWTTQPPNIFQDGQLISVGWQISNGSSVAYSHLHVARNAADVKTNPDWKTSAQGGGTGTYSASISPSGIYATTFAPGAVVYFMVHAGTDEFGTGSEPNYWSSLASSTAGTVSGTKGNLQITFDPNPATALGSCNSGYQFHYGLSIKETNGVAINLLGLEIDSLDVGLSQLGLPSRIGPNGTFNVPISYCRGAGISSWTISSQDDTGYRGTWTGTIELTTQASATASVFGVDSTGTLVKINIQTGTAAPVGNTGYNEVGDIAFTPDGSLYGVASATFSNDSLIQISPTNGAATRIGSLGLALTNALASDSDGTLYGATLDGRLITIDRATGVATTIGSYGSGLQAAGDIAFAPDGTLYGTIRGASSDSLAVINKSTGVATVIGPIGFPSVWGLAFDPNGTLYGAANGNLTTATLITIDPKTGSGTPIGPINGANGTYGLSFGN